MNKKRVLGLMMAFTMTATSGVYAAEFKDVKDSRGSGRAIICAEYQIYRTFAYTPGIGNEGGMC